MSEFPTQTAPKCGELPFFVHGILRAQKVAEGEVSCERSIDILVDNHQHCTGAGYSDLLRRRRHRRCAGTGRQTEKENGAVQARSRSGRSGFFVRRARVSHPHARPHHGRWRRGAREEREAVASMTCPFLKETEVKYCGTATVRKLIPLAQTGRTEDKCSSVEHSTCPVWRQQPEAIRSEERRVGK